MSKGGERIARILEDLGWSQEKLGRSLGVSRETVSRWVNGKNVPGYDHVIAAEALLAKAKKRGA